MGEEKKAETNWNLSPYLPILPCLNHFLSTFRPKYSLAFLTEEPVIGTFVSWLSPDVTTRRVPIHLPSTSSSPPIHFQFCSPSTPHYAYFRTACYSPSKKPSSRPIFKLRTAPAVAEIFPFCCRFTCHIFLSWVALLLPLWTSYQTTRPTRTKSHNF